jgi:hypothetical protein
MNPGEIAPSVPEQSTGTFVCTTGRSGSIYLTRVFENHTVGGTRVLHEQITAADVAGCLPGQHLIITGRKTLSEIFDQVAAFRGPKHEARFIFMVRDLVSTCMSWVRYLVLRPDYVSNSVPCWWRKCRMIKFNPSWSAFQRFVWHWFMTWMRTSDLMRVHQDSPKMLLKFNDLNNVNVMNDMMKWVGHMNACSKESLARSREEGTKHKSSKLNIDRVGKIDAGSAIRLWVRSLDPKTLRDVQDVLRWLKSVGYTEPTSPMFGV